MFNQCSMQLLLLAHFSFITGVCIFWRIKGCKVSHLSLQDHPHPTSFSFVLSDADRSISSFQDLARSGTGWCIAQPRSYGKKAALPAANWEKAVHRSPIPTVTGVADSDRLFAWLKLCKPANHAAPQGTSALPCVRVLTEGPPFEPKIYFRNEHGDSSWMWEQSWNTYLLYDY